MAIIVVLAAHFICLWIENGYIIFKNIENLVVLSLHKI